MEKSRQFNQEQKPVILESAKEVGIKEASRIVVFRRNRQISHGQFIRSGFRIIENIFG